MTRGPSTAPRLPLRLPKGTARLRTLHVVLACPH
jgi:hypothetical protein